jgi:hypothetical protein
MFLPPQPPLPAVFLGERMRGQRSYYRLFRIRKPMTATDSVESMID